MGADRAALSLTECVCLSDPEKCPHCGWVENTTTIPLAVHRQRCHLGAALTARRTAIDLVAHERAQSETVPA
jgi:hypothetical protein